MGKRIRQLSTRWIHRLIYSIWIKPIESYLIPALRLKRPGKLRNFGLRLAAWCANLGRVVILDLRMSVKCLQGSDWAVIYIGEGSMQEALTTFLFPQPPEVVDLQRISLWQVPEQADQYVRQGELVICELNEIIPWKPRNGNQAFSMPVWVSQQLTGIDRPIDELLSGMNQTMRRHIRQLDGRGYSYVYTRTQEDFDLFYSRMYCAYIESRFSGRGAILHEYGDVLETFRKGGLILVRQGQEPVCGMICEISGDTCIARQMGVMDGRFDLVKGGAEVALWWFMLDWARKQGARTFDFGGSWPLLTNGTFNFKRQWGTRVRKYEDMYTRWNFLAQHLPKHLSDYLNTRGLIVEHQNKFYSTVFLQAGETLDPAKLTEQRKKAVDCGLEGILTITSAEMAQEDYREEMTQTSF